MVERLRPRLGGNYFPQEEEERPKVFIRSGCVLLDCVLGGGWPLGRTSNIVGDKSTGKTLLAIEACANFARVYPKGKIWYREAEAAFDIDYATQLGLPVRQVDFGAEGIDTLWNTIEEVIADILQVTAKERAKPRNKQTPGLYIIDSLDALSDIAEQDRAVGEGSYGASKAKQMSELFRRCTREIKATKIHLMVISQIRDRIGIRFGERYGRSGGHALDFYASQILWLHYVRPVVRKLRGTERTVGIRVKAKCKKNKIGAPFRDCEFDIHFGYGIRDMEASLAWLSEMKLLPRLKLKEDFIAEVAALPASEATVKALWLQAQVVAAWQEVERGFLPERRKYDE